MRATLVVVGMALGLAACSSHEEKTVVQPERTLVQTAPQPPPTVIVPGPGSTIVCPPGATC